MRRVRIVLHQPEIAGNFGNILRTCACFGLPLSVVGPTGFPLRRKDVRRAAMDYGRAVDLTRHVDWAEYTRTSARRVLFTTRGAVAMQDFAFEFDDHLVFGAESCGVPDGVHADCDSAVLIPIVGGSRSLNLGNAVAVAAWEALRQTNGLGKAGP